MNNCTSWVGFRRQMLGLSLRSGNGGTWATDPNGVPTLGGIVSWQDGGAGHVMFIEEVNPHWSFRVSEMNYDRAGEFRDNVIWRRHGEQWISDPGGRVRTLYIDP